MKCLGLVAAISVVAAASFFPLRASAHVIIYKTCLAEVVESVSSPLSIFSRRPDARHSAVYSWRALSSDKFGAQYSDLALSQQTRTLCARSDSGGFNCTVSAVPCREVEDCTDAGTRECIETEE